MTDKTPHEDEHELLEEAKETEGSLSILNQMGVDEAARKPLLREALKGQLSLVHDNISHYLPTQPRGWGDDNQMPHEWGSMDTYDDMRNSVRALSVLLEGVLDFSGEDESERTVILEALKEGGACACADEVEEAGKKLLGIEEGENAHDELWDHIFEKED